MLDIQEKPAVCEFCKGKLLFRNIDNLECENCGVNYSADWVRTKTHELNMRVDNSRIKFEESFKEETIFTEESSIVVEDAPSQLFSAENAESMYNEAIEHLKNRDEQKALSTLREMLDKYPGNERGWKQLVAIEKSRCLRSLRNANKRYEELLKLPMVSAPVRNGNGYAELLKNIGSFVKQAVNYNDPIFIEEISKTLSTYCDNVKNGTMIFWPAFFTHYRFIPQVEKLFVDAEEAGNFYNSLENKYRLSLERAHSSKHPYNRTVNSQLFLGARAKVYSEIYRKPYRSGDKLKYIIGRTMIFELMSTVSGPEHSPVLEWILISSVSKKSVTKKSCQEIVNKIKFYVENRICPKCDSALKKPLISGWRCDDCDKDYGV